MATTLHALGEILLRAVPTFVLVVFLHFYLKLMFFRPMQKVLAQRYAATEGAREVAEQSLARAAAKTAEYEAALRKATGEIFEANEKHLKELQEQQETAVRAARHDADAAVTRAKQELARDVEAAKVGLGAETEMLASQIAETVLMRSAA